MYKSRIKICGIKDINTLNCCINSKVDFFGLIFFNKSPRNIKINDAINLVNYSKNKKIFSVGVFVNEKIDNLNNLLKDLKIDYIQFHGKETNDYIKYIKKNHKIKIIKAISIKNNLDFDNINNFNSADYFLFDYKPLISELPGGNAKKFNWDLIKTIDIDRGWFLSGGVNIDNINDIKNYAIPYGIDISSGVEETYGIKNKLKIQNLMESYV